MNHFKPIWFHRYVIVVPLLVVLGACAPVLTSNTATPPASPIPVLDTPAPVVTPSPTATVEKGNSADETDEPSADRDLVSYRGTNPHYESSPPFEIVYSPSFWEYMPGDGPGRVAQLVHRDMADCSLSLGGGGMEALPVSTLNLAGTAWTVFQVQPQHLQYLSQSDDSFFLFSLALPEAYADNPEGPCLQAVQDVLMTFKIEGQPPPPLPNDDKGPLVVREWPIVPATVIGPGRFEYNDVLGEEILSYIRALRDQSAERSLALTNEALAPFGYRLDSRFDADWDRTFYDLYREGEAEPLLPGLSPLWEVPLNASVNAPGTDFVLVVENAPNTRPLYLLVNSDEVQEWDSGESWARPGYVGDDLARVTRTGDVSFTYQVELGTRSVYTGTAALHGAYMPLRSFTTWDGHWVLEVDDQLIMNSEDIGQTLGYDAAFGFARIGGQPFYFFEQSGLVVISYGGQLLPNFYEQVFHNRCCEAAIHNVEAGPEAVWFHALRDGVWYWVEARKPTPSEVSDRAGEELALQSLMDFFEHLSAGRYEEASQLYGGSYEVLIDNNPTLDPQDHAALLRNACTANGFQCLRVRSARLQEDGASGSEYRFLVEFSTPDDQLFVRGPCCGASETDMPSQSEFLFSVTMSEDGAYRVQDLPVYVP